MPRPLPFQLPLDFSVPETRNFDNFLVSERNAELLSLLRAVPQEVERRYFIWGRQGAGKSHLLQALCRQDQRCAYVPLRKSASCGPQILEGLEDCHTACLDDIEAVLGDRVWEEGLFALFNRAWESRCRLALSAALSPRELPFALPDLASRCNGGVVYQLFELDDAEKMIALRGHAEERNILLGDDVLNYIFLRNSRDLQGLLSTLAKLNRLSWAEKRKLTIPFVRKVMGW